MTTQLLRSSTTHSSDSRYTSPALDAGIVENEPVLEGAGTFRTPGCPVFRSTVPVTFEVLMSPILMGEPVCDLVGCSDKALGPARLDAWSRCFSNCPKAAWVEHFLRFTEKGGLKLTNLKVIMNVLYPRSNAPVFALKELADHPLR